MKPIQNRIAWIDATKGLAMLLVMWGHVQHSSPLKLWLTSFHVPVFLVLTGVLFAYRGKTSSPKNLLGKLLRPFITFSAMAIVCYLAYNTYSDGLQFGLREAGINVYKTITAYGILAIWFIPSYFIACFAFSKTSGHSLKMQFLFLLLWATIGMLGSRLFDFMREAIGSQTAYQALYFPLAAILRGLACTYYVVLGKILYEIFVAFRQEKGFYGILALAGTACLVLNIYLSRYLEGTSFSILSLGNTPYMTFICGTLGSIWVIILFYLLRKAYSFPVLQYVGRKSLIIMGTHMSLLLTVVVPIFFKHTTGIPADQTVSYYLYGVACVVLMMLIEIPVISLLEGRLGFLMKRNG